MAKTFQLQDLVVSNGGDGEVHDNFKDALRDLYARVMHVMDSDCMTYQWLETMVWIAVEDPEASLRGPIYFYDARDVAAKHGLDDDGGKEVKDGGQEPDHDILVEVALLCAINGGAEEYIQGLKKVA